MASTSRNDENQYEQDDSDREPRKYRFELTRARLFVYCLGLTAVFTWMFAFGVLVGRGIPLVSIGDTSIRAEFLRFMGLGRETPPPPEDVADTWEPQKMLESLNYYEDLTQKNASISVSAKPSSAVAAAPAPTPKPASREVQVPKPKTATPASPPANAQAAPEPEKTAPPEPPVPKGAGEHFTLLVGSLKDVDNAQRMLDQLKTKGYPVRLESLDLSAGGHWNRVLVGSFRNREEALRFAAEFNRKERMEGLIIREGQ